MFPEKKSSAIPLGAAIALGLLLVAAAFGSGYLAGERNIAQAATRPSFNAVAPSDVDFSAVWKAWSIIDERFVPASVATSSKVATSTDEANQARVWGMIEGLASSLDDPYTYFLPPTEAEQFTADMSGRFEGVGMEIAVKDKVLTVVAPLKGTPSEKAGIKSGDHILKIDGTSTEGMDVGAAVQKIRGPKGTTVTLTIVREGDKAPREIKVVRDVINVPVVTTTKRDDGVFVIELATFTANSSNLFRNALREFVESKSTKLVLDLRGNPGGYLESAVEIASWFIPRGKVVVTEDYAGHAENSVHRSFGNNVFNKNLKMVILVDQGSASASEIVADALQQYDLATLVGTNTFGKGSVQELVDIADGSSLKITVARWLGPNGEQIPRNGIVPDVVVKLTEEDAKADRDPQMDKAVELLK